MYHPLHDALSDANDIACIAGLTRSVVRGDLADIWQCAAKTATALRQCGRTRRSCLRRQDYHAAGS